MEWGRLARAARDLFDDALDALLPPRAATARTKMRGFADIPLAPAMHQLVGKEITTLLDYQKAETRDLIRSLKYEGSSYAAQLLSRILADYLREEIASLKTF